MSGSGVPPQRVAVRPRRPARDPAAALGRGDLQLQEVPQPHRLGHGRPELRLLPGRRRGRVLRQPHELRGPAPRLLQLPGSHRSAAPGRRRIRHQGRWPTRRTWARSRARGTSRPFRTCWSTPGTAWTPTSCTAGPAASASREAPARGGRSATPVAWTATTPNVKGREGNLYGGGCNIYNPYQLNARASGSYTIPWVDVLAGVAFQSRPGNAIAANLNVPFQAAVWEPASASRAGTLFNGVVATTTQTVNLLDFGDLYGERTNNWDLTLRKNIRFAGKRLNFGVDIYNLLQQRRGDGLQPDLHRVPGRRRHVGERQSGHAGGGSEQLGEHHAAREPAVHAVHAVAQLLETVSGQYRKRPRADTARGRSWCTGSPFECRGLCTQMRSAPPAQS